MDPMFLPEVEAAVPPGPSGDAIREMRASGRSYPQIAHLIAYKPEATKHLLRHTQAVMRGEGPLSPAQRETIAALVSTGNCCHF